MIQPVVSIVIPARNRAGLIGHTLESLRAQTYPFWQAVVVDDKSDDATAAEAKAWAAQEPRICVLHRRGSRGGAQVCRNQGIEAARGDYVILLDSDDLLAPYCLEQRVQAMQASPGLDFAVFPMQMMKAQPGDTSLLSNALFAEDDLDRFCAADLPWMITGPIWKRDALQRVGPWNESLPSWQDWEYHVRALALGLRYDKYVKSDSYWRVGHSGRINSSFGNAHYCMGLCPIIAPVWEALCANGKTSVLRRRLLVGLLVTLVMRILVEDAGAALQLWRAVSGSTLLTAGQASEGDWVMRWAQGAGSAQPFVDYLARRFPEQVMLRRIFCGKSPVGRGASVERSADDENGLNALTSAMPERPSRGRAVASLMAQLTWRGLRRPLSRTPLLWRLGQRP